MEQKVTNREIGIRVVEMSGFSSALQALHLPFGKEVVSIAQSEYDSVDQGSKCVHTSSFCSFNEKDLKLMQRLVSCGDQHAKVVRGINAYIEINAPRYFWQEMDTYRIGTERLASESTMHIQGKQLSEEDLLKIKEELPEGTFQKRIQMFSYQTLRRIFFQRHNHRLPQWRQFCQFIRTLPLAEELILTGLEYRYNGDGDEKM